MDWTVQITERDWFLQILLNRKKTCPRVVINREPVGIFNDFTFFNDEDCGRDIFHPSSCDEAALLMASALGYNLS